MATILLSFGLLLVIFAALVPAPKTGKLGFAVGIMLAVFAVLQLIAFAVLAAFSAKREKRWGAIVWITHRH